jgi:hypothetical protein
MQITRAGVTVQPLAFQFGVVLLSGGGETTGGTPGSGPSGGPGDTGGGNGLPYLGGLFLALATGGLIAASTPPPSTPPAVAAGPVITAPGTSAGGPPAAGAAPLAAAPGAPGPQQARSTPAPIVLAASAAQTKPVPAGAPTTKGPGLVLPYTGANLWIPFASGAGLIGLGVWLRRCAEGFKQG